MARSLYILLIYASFLVAGPIAPFVFSLGYVWVDTFTPQNIAYIILPDIPVSFIMGAVAVGGYLFLDRKRPPRTSFIVVLLVALAIWVTISTAFWAVAPAAAWTKWDHAYKLLLFSAFFPYVFRSRVQIESFLQIYLFSLVVQFLPLGLKTIISGGGYGVALGIVNTNTGLSEGATLSAVSLMQIPIILFLRTNGLILPRSRLTDLLYLGLIAGAVAAAVGTYERTALIGMLVVGIGLWLRAKRKGLGLAVGVVAAILVIAVGSDKWSERIATTADYRSESSALGRILVWEWTMGFVAEHPEGGGFNSFLINRIEYPGTPDHPEPVIERRKAFHSIYFEMLGEQGFVGLGILFGLIFGSLAILRRVAKKAKQLEGMGWLTDLAYAVQVSLLTLLACGLFIGIAFQPMLYYMFALSACLGHYIDEASVVHRGTVKAVQPAVAGRQTAAARGWT